jgi:hypothetical protein
MAKHFDLVYQILARWYKGVARAMPQIKEIIINIISDIYANENKNTK